MTMRTKKLLVVLVLILVAGFLSPVAMVRGVGEAPKIGAVPPVNETFRQTLRFRLDSSRSQFIAHAQRGGLLWFKGHEHLVAAREFSGEAQLNAASLGASSLELTVKTDSMAETSDAFTEAQKQIINGELREIVLTP